MGARASRQVCTPPSISTHPNTHTPIAPNASPHTPFTPPCIHAIHAHTETYHLQTHTIYIYTICTPQHPPIWTHPNILHAYTPFTYPPTPFAGIAHLRTHPTHAHHLHTSMNKCTFAGTAYLHPPTHSLHTSNTHLNTPAPIPSTHTSAHTCVHTHKWHAPTHTICTSQHVHTSTSAHTHTL